LPGCASVRLRFGLSGGIVGRAGDISFLLIVCVERRPPLAFADARGVPNTCRPALHSVRVNSLQRNHSLYPAPESPAFRRRSAQTPIRQGYTIPTLASPRLRYADQLLIHEFTDAQIRELAAISGVLYSTEWSFVSGSRAAYCRRSASPS
jgi:hypothetical protein